MRRQLLVLTLGLLALRPHCGLAETPDEIKARLERGRALDRQEALRRQATLDWQRDRKAEEYARTWKQYGNPALGTTFEVNVLKWWKQVDGNWVTYAKFADISPSSSNTTLDELVRSGIVEMPKSESIRPPLGLPISPRPPLRFDQSLDELVSQGVLSCDERFAFDKPKSGNATCSPSKASLIGVSCSSLHVNKKLPYRAWGKWERPSPGSPEEALLIDRCSRP